MFEQLVVAAIEVHDWKVANALLERLFNQALRERPEIRACGGERYIDEDPEALEAHNRLLGKAKA